MQGIIAVANVHISMFEKFTDRSRKVMSLAEEEAHRLKHEYIGTEHILLGLLKEGEGVAAKVLNCLNVDLDKAHSYIERVVVEGVTEAGPEGRFTPRAKSVIDYSWEEARKLDHLYIGTEHLFLGLLRDTESVAAMTLDNLGVNTENARKEVLSLLGHFED